MKRKHKNDGPWKRLEKAARSRGLIGRTLAKQHNRKKGTGKVNFHPDLLALREDEP